MSNRARILVPAAVVLGVVFVGLAILYAAEPAKSLPLPDALGDDSSSGHHHVKHAIAALLLGAAGPPTCLVAVRRSAEA